MKNVAEMVNIVFKCTYCGDCWVLCYLYTVVYIDSGNIIVFYHTAMIRGAKIGYMLFSDIEIS